MIIVTGAAGFIGSNLVKKLNAQGNANLILVDDLKDGSKYLNIKSAEFSEYYDVDEFFTKFKDWYKVKSVYHQGAISSTTATDGKEVMHYNYRYSIDLINKCVESYIPISYASSASVYGNTQDGSFDPLNLYAYSKALVDQYVNKIITKTRLIHGWRYFNVYGTGEDHKGSQASPLTQFKNQALETGVIKIFEGSDTIYRDFVCVNDVVNIIVDFMNNEAKSGIRNLGTGRITSFTDVAHLCARKYGATVEVIPFPEELKSKYQYMTQAKDHPEYKFTTIADWLLTQ